MANDTVTATKVGPRKGVFGSIGPGFITAALVFGPGSITTASSMGASYGDQLLWVPVIATILRLCFVDLGVRIGLSTDHQLRGAAVRLLIQDTVSSTRWNEKSVARLGRPS